MKQLLRGWTWTLLSALVTTQVGCGILSSRETLYTLPGDALPAIAFGLQAEGAIRQESGQVPPESAGEGETNYFRGAGAPGSDPAGARVPGTALDRGSAFRPNRRLGARGRWAKHR